MTPTTKPWYRQFWPWFLIALPATAVCASIYTVFLAAAAPPALVVDDYKKIGLATRRSFELDEQARALGLQATLEVGDGSPARLSLALAGQPDPMPEVLVLNLAHPTLAELDQRILLLPEGGRFVGLLPLRQPRYYVQLEPADSRWRLSGQLHSNSTVVELRPREQD